MANYTKTTIGKESRIELHEKLSLTGAEISLNELPAGANVPFVHYHKENEEIYGILSGNGKVIIDGEEIRYSLILHPFSAAIYQLSGNLHHPVFHLNQQHIL